MRFVEAVVVRIYRQGRPVAAKSCYSYARAYLRTCGGSVVAKKGEEVRATTEPMVSAGRQRRLLLLV